ncbi:L-histidine N(alpha)-methyltransferase [Streptomyces bryophytorum]|uniref:Gamma-glutamyl-hercynylcysteine sulfoxide hydrolase n=2 Tax=Actinacidiphila bryophytorum TaxID=1436133 RepID=A0A9W4E2A4_9ACTN|nr:L-histidine N(alpha)-methyltransferase [Actinacidiphila bryophytorum]MBN6545333.1 L-histidine N(alpha)-methyltransferase [Actinacidiphila bryophytorum]CAG7597894.1 Gamma-glutamyl-hercynylcysteine sulfoxide hydrolase [Actinacidiphila bryophytorum]
MCRHLAYVGPPATLERLLVRPAHGLYEQSWQPRRQRYGTVNADGFGVGWYPLDQEDDTGFTLPVRYRRAVPVWADANFAGMAAAIRSGAVLAAVRSATAGTTQDESAAAPFTDGRWLFSHNGAVRDWTRLPTGLAESELLGMEARSDSAALWAMLKALLRQGQPPGGALASVVRRVAAARPDARLNLLLTDGRTIAATAWGDTLWYRTGPGAALVASEPDEEPARAAGSEDAGDAGTDAGKPAGSDTQGTDTASPPGLGEWREVPDRSLLLATTAGVRIIPLRPPGAADRKERHRMAESRFTLDDRLPAGYFTDSLHADVRKGLSEPPRTLPPKWFYDKRGSDLFEEITRLPEYYPTRAEQEILTRRAPEIAALTRASTLIELGSGSSRKTRLLLDALTAGGSLVRYAPLDVSSSALAEAGEAICRDYPGLAVTATVADFEGGLPLSDEPGPRLLAFLGSTIGNFDADQRRAFYRTLALALSSDDVLLLGADLVKDPDVLVRAYDDAQGVTADFNKNVLYVLNRELGADFDPDAFEHVALWNAEEERIEMRLRSRTAQTVKIPDLDLSLDLAAGEDLRTELSCKFRRESLTAELHEGGFTVRQWWTDPDRRFALLLAVPN